MSRGVYIILLLACAGAFVLGLDCGGLPITGAATGFAGTLSFPLDYNGINNYTSNTTCGWSIQTSGGLGVTLSFTHLNLSCGDEIHITYASAASPGGVTLPPVTCASEAPLTLVAEGAVVNVTFISAETSPTDVGFVVEYMTMPLTYCENTRYFNSSLAMSGTISNPTPFGNLNVTAAASGACLYQINAPVGTAVRINVTGVDFPAGMLAFTRPDTYSLGSVTGATAVGALFWSTGPMYMRWTVPNAGPFGLGWQIDYTVLPDATSGCAGVVPLSGLSGSFAPYTPYGGGVGLYHEYATCAWSITVPAGNFVQLTFPGYDLGPLYDGIVRIYDANNSMPANLLTTVIGVTALTVDINSTGPAMYVTFTSQLRYAGFQTTWQAIAFAPPGATGPCAPATTFTDAASGTLASTVPLGGSIRYPVQTACAWTLKMSNASYVFHLTFTSFDLMNDDVVSVYDGVDDRAPLIAVLTGTPGAEVYTSTGPDMHVAFLAQSINGSGPGFAASFTSFYFPPICRCNDTVGVNISVPDTGFVRAGWPCPYTGADYDEKTTCKWYFFNPNGTRLQASFAVFATEQDYDFVTFYEGRNMSAKLVSFSGEYVATGKAIAVADTMTIVFTSDWSVEYSGFILNVAVVPASLSQQCFGVQTLDLSQGSIQVPLNASYAHYTPGLNCAWLVRVPKGYTVSLTVVAADIADDMLYIGDGPTTSFPNMWQGQIGVPLNGTTRMSYVSFFTNSVNEGAGFLITFTATTPNLPCDNTFSFTQCSGAIISQTVSGPGVLAAPCPFGSTSYSNNYACTQTLVAGDDQIFTVKVYAIDLSPGDHLSIDDGYYATELAGLYSGMDPSFYNYTTSSNELTIDFYSIGSGPKGRGWILAYSLIPYPGDMCRANTQYDRGTSGGLIGTPTPYGLGNYVEGLSCQWSIDASTTGVHHIEFVLVDLDIGESTILSVRDGSYYSSPALVNPTAPGSWVTSTYYMTVVFTAGAGTTGKGFRGYWRIADTSSICNASTVLVAQHLAASVAVPVYGAHVTSYAPMMNCSWLIEPETPGDMVYITVMNLNLGDGDTLTIEDETGVVFGILTDTLAYTYVSYMSSKRIRVLFSSDLEDNGGGFRFHYSSGYPAPCDATACVGSLTATNSRPYGLMGAPCPYGSGQTVNYGASCRWLITGIGMGIKYKLLNYSLSYSSILRIYEGSTTGAPSILLNAAAIDLPRYTSSNTLLVSYQARAYEMGFVMSYDTGGNISTPASTWSDPTIPTSSSSSATLSSSYSSTTDDGTDSYLPSTATPDSFLPIFLGSFFGVAALIACITIGGVVYTRRRVMQAAAGARTASTPATTTPARTATTLRTFPAEEPAPAPRWRTEAAANNNNATSSGSGARVKWQPRARPTVEAGAVEEAGEASSSSGSHEGEAAPGDIPMRAFAPPPAYNDVAPPAYADVAASSNATATPPTTRAAVKNCAKCQAPLARGARFCGACGTPTS